MYQSLRGVITLEIPTGATGLSGAVDVAERCLLGIVMPAAWTAANLTFQAGTSTENLANVHDEEGNEVTVTAAAGRYIQIPPNLLRGARFLRIRSGTTATPVNQEAARTLLLVVAVVY